MTYKYFCTIRDDFILVDDFDDDDLDDDDDIDEYVADYLVNLKRRGAGTFYKVFIH